MRKQFKVASSFAICNWVPPFTRIFGTFLGCQGTSLGSCQRRGSCTKIGGCQCLETGERPYTFFKFKWGSRTDLLDDDKGGTFRANILQGFSPKKSVPPLSKSRSAFLHKGVHTTPGVRTCKDFPTRGQNRFFPRRRKSVALSRQKFSPKGGASDNPSLASNVVKPRSSFEKILGAPLFEHRGQQSFLRFRTNGGETLSTNSKSLLGPEIIPIPRHMQTTSCKNSLSLSFQEITEMSRGLQQCFLPSNNKCGAFKKAFMPPQFFSFRNALFSKHLFEGLTDSRPTRGKLLLCPVVTKGPPFCYQGVCIPRSFSTRHFSPASLGRHSTRLGCITLLESGQFPQRVLLGTKGTAFTRSGV